MFYLKANLQCTKPFRKKLTGSWLSSLFTGNDRQHMAVCAYTISWARKVLSIAKVHMSLGTL